MWHPDPTRAACSIGENPKPSPGALVFHWGGAMVIFTGFHGSAS